jgi:hypothetical protein
MRRVIVIEWMTPDGAGIRGSSTTSGGMGGFIFGRRFS